MKAKQLPIEDEEFIPRVGDVDMDELETEIKPTNNSNSSKEMTLADMPGIGPATLEKLQLAGFIDLMAVGVATPGELIEATGMSEAAAKKIINCARANLKMGFQSGEDLLKKRALVIKFKTGSSALDGLLGGGFESGAITECFGEFGSGKTQIGHVLTVNTIKNYPDSYVVYIDTENTFRPERIKQLADGAGVDFNEVLKHIKVARAYNSDHQMLLAEKVEDLIKKENCNVKLVVVDSLTAHFRAEFIGRGTLAERQQKINKHMHVLLKLADTNNLAVYVTNQVSSDPAQFFGDPTKPIGGNIVAHASTFRIYLRKGKKGSRVAKLIDSPNLPDGEIAFIVETPGIKDI
jgi:DNA repair protein RadA